MLTEEAHHMFVGEMGIARVVARTCELMNRHRTDKVGEYGAFDLPIIQRYLNFHYSVSLDLFGSEVSTNAANYYSAGLKGRFRETDQPDDHILADGTYSVLRPEGGRLLEASQPALLAINEMLRDEYIRDSARGVARWNKIIRDAGINFELRLPHRAFNRHIGEFAGLRISPDGEMISDDAWRWSEPSWLPTIDDQQFVRSLMKPEYHPGKFASWLTAPARGINHQPLDFEYVKFTADHPEVVSDSDRH
jgi:benzoyl-CoA 2,3-dioxygenase component B